MGIGGDAGREVRVAAHAGRGFLDGLFKSFELGATANADVDFSRGGEAVELNAKVRAELLVHRAVAIVCPYVLNGVSVRDFFQGGHDDKTDQLEAAAIVRPCNDVSPNSGEQ